MGLNIKNEATCDAIRRLAKVSGQSLTKAVDVAVRRQLLEVEHDGRASKVDQILAIGRECARHLTEPWRSIDHGELLYDEDGMPK